MENKFVDGLFVNERKNAPDFVRAKLSIRVDQFVQWLQDNKNDKGYVNLDILTSKAGKDYAKENDFKPDPSKNGYNQAPSGQSYNQAPPIEIKDDLPF